MQTQLLLSILYCHIWWFYCPIPAPLGLLRFSDNSNLQHAFKQQTQNLRWLKPAPATALPLQWLGCTRFYLHLHVMGKQFFVLLMVSCRDVHHLMNMERMKDNTSTVFGPSHQIQCALHSKYNVQFTSNTMPTNEQIHCSREIQFSLHYGAAAMGRWYQEFFIFERNHHHFEAKCHFHFLISLSFAEIPLVKIVHVAKIK